jgi:hypothetical protein
MSARLRGTRRGSTTTFRDARRSSLREPTAYNFWVGWDLSGGEGARVDGHSDTGDEGGLA